MKLYYVCSFIDYIENKFKSPSICPEYSICSKSIMIKIKGVSSFSQHAVCTGIMRLSSSCQPIIFFTLTRCPCAPLLSCLASSCSDFEFLCEGQRVVEGAGGLGGSSDFRSSARFTRDTRSRYARTTARSNWVTVSRGTAFSCPWENAACWHRLLHTPRSVFIDERLSFISRLFHAPWCNDTIIVHSWRTHKRRLSDQVLANFSYRKSNDDWFPRPFSLSSTRKFTCRSGRLPRWVQ